MTPDFFLFRPVEWLRPLSIVEKEPSSIDAFCKESFSQLNVGAGKTNELSKSAAADEMASYLSPFCSASPRSVACYQ